MAVKSLWHKFTDEGRFLFVLAAAALALRLFRIGVQSLWVDEMLTMHVSNPVKEGLNIWSYLKYNIHGPLHSLSVYLIQFINANDGWLRLPSALAGTGTVVYFYLWTRSWLGRVVGRICAVLLAVHPLHMFYSQEVRNYSFLLLFAAMAFYHFHRLMINGRRKDWIWYVIAITFAALSNFTAAFLYAAHTLVFFARKGFHRKVILRWVTVSLVILILISPWVYRIYTFIDVSDLVTPVMPGQLTPDERLRGKTTVSPAALPYAFYTFGVGFSLGPSTRELHADTTVLEVLRKHVLPITWVAVLFGGLWLFGIWKTRSQKMPWVELGLYFLLPIVCTFILNWQNAKAFNVRYVLLSLLPFLCFVAAAINGLPARARAAALGLVVATLLFSTGNYYFNGRYARDDVKGAVRFIERQGGDGYCVFAPTVSDIVLHYLRNDAPVYAIRTDWMTMERVEVRLEEMFAGCNSLWYLSARPWLLYTDGYISERITNHYDKAKVVEFNGVTLTKYEKKKGSIIDE
jgi:uncharacterized membrane protein